MKEQVLFSGLETPVEAAGQKRFARCAEPMSRRPQQNGYERAERVRSNPEDVYFSRLGAAKSLIGELVLRAV
jgi:hypothetical protein